MSVSIYRKIQMSIEVRHEHKLIECLERNGIIGSNKKYYGTDFGGRLKEHLVRVRFECCVTQEEFEHLVNYLQNDFPYHVIVYA